MNIQKEKISEGNISVTERISGSEAVIRCLLAEGVKTLYGLSLIHI